MKRFLALFLVCCLIVSALSVPAFAADSIVGRKWSCSTTGKTITVGSSDSLSYVFDASLGMNGFGSSPIENIYSSFPGWSGIKRSTSSLYTLPAGSTATINGTNYTNGEKFELDPKKDFYCLTIKAEDQYTITKYYFVTRYENGTIPFSTVSDDTKALAKELLGKWYTDLTAPGYTFGSYWNVFMAKATTGTSDRHLTLIKSLLCTPQSIP